MALLSEVDDERIKLATINAVKLTPDLRYARIYWSLVKPDSSEREVTAASRSFGRATGFLRKYLARNLQLRYVPELDFQYDVSMDRGRRLDDLIDGLDIPPPPDPTSEEE